MKKTGITLSARAPMHQHCANPRTRAAGLPRNPEFDQEPRQPVAQTQHQQEDQDGETEKHEGLRGIFGLAGMNPW